MMRIRVVTLALSEVVLLLVAGMLLGVWDEQRTAEAHAVLERSEPTAGATLSEAPLEIRLWFTEPLEATYTGADLLDAAGDPVPGVTTAIAPEDAHELIVTPPADLANGTYTVAWRTLSAADGHTLQGYFGFSVGSATAGAVVQAAQEPSSDDIARPLTRGLALLGLAALLAIAPVTLWVLQPAARTSLVISRSLTPALRRYTVAAAAFAILASIAALGAQAAVVAPDVSLPGAMAQTLSATRYGQVWLLRLVLLILCIVPIGLALWGRERWRRGALLVATAVAIVVPVPFSLLSHAAAQAEGSATAIAADAIHLLAASIWTGGLLLLAVVLTPALRAAPAGERWATLRPAISRFTVVGLAAWGVLLLTGLYSAWLQVGTLAALVQTPYGQTLLLKGILLLLALGLAAFHLILGWRGGTARSRQLTTATLAAEALLAVVVLLVVGRLVGLEPAREDLASRAPTQLDVPLSLAADDGALAAQLSISPGAAGVNTFTLSVDGTPLPDGAEAVLRFSLPGRDIGEEELDLPAVAPNRFAAEGAELALPGDWQITAIVRKIGAFSWQTTSAVAVAATPPPSPAENPAPRFAPAGVLGMIAVAIGVAALAAAVALRRALAAARVGLAGAGAVALIVGAAILGVSRLPMPSPAPVIAQEVPPPSASPRAATPHVMANDHHAMASAAATPLALPAPGTPVTSDGLTVAVSVTPRNAGPATVAIDLAGPDGKPLPDARVVVLNEMPGMPMGRSQTTAKETDPGHYVAEPVPLGMEGAWRLTVRVSPRGQATQSFPFAVTME